MPQNPNMGRLAARPAPAPPEPGFLDRLLAALPSIPQRNVQPLPARPGQPANVEEAMRIVQKEDPTFDPSIVGPKTRVPVVGNFQVPQGAQAAATPFGNIRYDPAVLNGQ